MRRFALGMVALLGACVAMRAADAAMPPHETPLFEGIGVCFAPDSFATVTAPDAHGVARRDRGRELERTLELPRPSARRLTLHVVCDPVAKSEREVWDRFDRAGNVRLVVPGAPDLELGRFMTAYGGHCAFDFDVTPYAPLLRGRVTVRAFIDTWSAPAWTLSATLREEASAPLDTTAWAAPVYFAPSFDAEHMPRGDSAIVVVPRGMRRVVLRFVSTGHCTDGTDADEFISKANVIRVDGRVVARVHPWRDDCRQYRDRNPYCTRWADGSWSCDYSRSGWCPGTEVAPLEFDLTDALTPGRHTVSFAIEDMRPRDAQGNYGYWRVSAALVGWDHAPALWRNPD